MAINPQAVRGPVTAIPVVAGTGVRFVEDVPNNRVVAEVDETVLWESTTANTGTLEIPEPISNFEKIGILFSGTNAYTSDSYSTSAHFQIFLCADLAVTTAITLGDFFLDANSGGTLVFRAIKYKLANDQKSLSRVAGTQLFYNGSTFSSNSNATAKVYKIVGINRISASA